MNEEGKVTRPNTSEQPVQPPVQPQTGQPMGQNTPKNKKIKKPVLIGLIVAAVLVVLGAGSALAYNLWYQNPDKVLADSMSNLVSRDSLSGKGTVVLDSKDSDMTLSIANQTLDGEMSLEANVDITANDTKMNIAGNAVYDKDGIFYIKVTNAAELMDALVEAQLSEYGETMSAEEQMMAVGFMKAMFEPIVDKVDGQWIKITPEDLDETGESEDELQCVSDALKQVSEDDAVQKELTKVYKDHTFMELTEKLGAKDGNLGFKYTLNEAKAEEFGKAIEETEIGKKVAACDTNKDDAEADETTDEDASETAEVTLELWVDRWSHDLASVTLVAISDEDEKLSFDYTPNYDEEVKIEVPTDTITLKELSDELNGLFSF